MLARQNEMKLLKIKSIEEIQRMENEMIEEERQKISKDIHDDIGVHLTGIKLSLERLKNQGDDEKIVNEVIETTSYFMEKADDAMFLILEDLFPTTLEKLGFRSAISQLCRNLNTAGVIKIAFEAENMRVRMLPKTELQLYRITQEVINNIIKHSGASTINIEITGDYKTTITISHNGELLTNADIKKMMETNEGLGLKSIQTRIEYIKATINYRIIDNTAMVIIEIAG